MAERPDDDNSEDPGRASDDRTDPLTALGGSSSRMSPTGTEVKSEGKRKKFRPLDAVRKLFKRRPKLKEIDSTRARSTSALYGHASGDGEEDDEEGGFLSRISLRKNKSRSEDSVLVEARTNQPGILRKLAYSVEGINKSIYSSNSGKSSSRNSLNSTESQEHFKEGLKGRRSSVENSEPSVDLEAVAKTEALNTDAAKFKISVRPKGRKGSRQSRKSRQKVASNLPCLNEEQHTFTSPSLTEVNIEEIARKMETEISAPEEETEPVTKKREQRIPLEDLPPKPRPKSTPITIHSTQETHQISNTAFDLESAEGSKHLANPELYEFGKIRSKSLDIEGKGQRYLDLGLSPVKKSNLIPKISKDDTETTDKYAKSNRKGLEIKDLEISVNKNTNILQKEPDSKNMELDEESVKVYGSREKGLDVGLDSQRSLLSPNFGDKSLKPMKSPISLDLGVKVDNEEKTQKLLKSPVGSLDLGLKSMKSPIQTPSLESKSLKDLSPTRSSDLESRALIPPFDSEDEIKSPKTPPVLGLKPLKIPIQATDFPLGFSKSLPSPIKQDKEIKSPKSLNKGTEDNVIEISDSPESLQIHLKSSKRAQYLVAEGPSETSKQVSQTYSLTKEKQSKEQKTSLLEAPNTENEDRPKSPKKIIASLELGNLTTKPLRSFSDPKSPRSSLRSPNLSPRSPILPPKPIRSPLGSPSLVGLDTKSSVKSFELPKLVSKLENTSESYENLHSKSPQSPLIAPKSFTLMSKSLKSPHTERKSPNEIPALVSKPLKEHSELANVGELTPNSAKKVPERPDLEQKSPSDTSSFSDLINKPLKKVSIEQNSGQKLSKSPSDSPNLEDSSENPFLKSINLESKSPKPDFIESTKLESKPLKTNFEDSNQTPLKKSLEKPSLGPKPLKSPVEAPNMGPKLNLPSNKMNKNNKPTEIQTEVEECRSQVGKNLEIFEAIGKRDTKITATPKISTGSKVTTLVSMADTSASSSMLEKSKTPEKSGIATSSKSGTGSSVTPNKSRMADASKLTDSSNSPCKVLNTFKMADTSNISDKPKVVTGGFKMMESSKMDSGSTVCDKPKIASTSKISDFSNKEETSKITTASSNTIVKLDDSSPKDPEPKPAPTTKITDSCKISDSSKVIATPTKNDSSKHSKETFSDEVNTVATSSKMTVDCPTKNSTKATTEPAKQSLAPKLKSFEQTSSAANETAGSGIDVTQNNTNRLSALFEAKSVAASHVDPGTTVKIEVIAKDDSSEQKTVKLREKGKSTEKISELSSRQSKVLDLVKNFQKLQAT